MRCLVAFWLFGLLIGLVAPAQTGTAPPKILAELVPGVVWESRVLSLDCDCDGKPDRAYLGRFKGHVFVGFASANGSTVDFLEFAVDAGKQAAICREPAKLELESLDYDPTEAVFFWNRKAKALDWWRL